MRQGRLNRLLTFLGGGVVLFALLLVLVRAILPLFFPTKITLSQQLSQTLKQEVTIGEYRIGWHGLRPIFHLDDVKILAPKEASSNITLSSVELRLSLLALFFSSYPAFDDVVVDGLKTDVNLTKWQQRLEGWDNAVTQSSLPFHRLSLINSKVLLLTQAQSQSVALSDVNMWVVNQRNKLKIKVIANIDEDSLTMAATVSKKKPITTLYCHWEGKALEALDSVVHRGPDIRSGGGQITSWLTLHHSTVTSLRANVSLFDLEVKQQGKVAVFPRFNGQLKFENTLHAKSFSAKDWQFEEGAPFSFQISKEGPEEEVQWRVSAKDVDVVKAYSFLGSLVTIPKYIENGFKRYPFEGKIEYASVLLKEEQEKFHPLFAQAQFCEGVVKGAEHLPTLNGANGTINFDGVQGQLFLQSDDITYSNLSLAQTAITLSSFGMYCDWILDKDKTQLNVGMLQGHLGDTLVTGKTQVITNAGSPFVKANLHLGSVTSPQALSLLAPLLSPDVDAWLNKAVLKGELVQTDIILNGRIGDFPFRNKPGHFELRSEIKGIDMEYASQWPPLTEVSGTVSLNNHSFALDANKGTIGGAPFDDLHLALDDVYASHPVLTLSGTAHSSLQRAKDIIWQTPLRHHLGEYHSSVQLNGPMELSLNVSLPLGEDNPKNMEIEGKLKTQDALVYLFDMNTRIEDVSGTLWFSQEGLHSNNLKGKLWEEPVHFSVITHKDNEQHYPILYARGKIDTNTLQKQWLVQPFEWMHGKTDYIAHIEFHSQTWPKIMFFSSLEGIGLDVPYPFGKLANAPRPLVMSLEPIEGDVKLTLSLGEEIQASSQFAPHGRKLINKGTHLHFGKTPSEKHEDDSLFTINGTLAEVDLGKWLDLIAFKGGTHPILTDLKLDVRLNTLLVSDQIFPDLQVQSEYDTTSQHTRLRLTSKGLKGNISFPSAHIPDPMNIDLEKCVLNKSDDTSYFETSLKALSRPIEINIKELMWNQRRFTSIQGRLEPAWKGVYISNGRLGTKDTDIIFSGSWDYLSSLRKVDVTGQLNTRNIGHTLGAFKFNDSLNDASGRVRFSLSWSGHPLKIDYPSLAGQADFSFRNGFVQGVNPGIGRLLGILNLDNVKRRLNLDFSDVTKNGLSFDSLSGRCQFAKGHVSANKILLDGPAAKIELMGETDFEEQALKGDMIVMPNVTSSLPIAAAIAAGNPAVGAIVWVADKLLGKKIQEINRYHYRVLGSWQSPVVEEIEERANLAGRSSR